MIAETMAGAEVRAALEAGRRDFSGVAFSGGIDLTGCNLRGATLPQIVAGGLGLTGCNLRGATLPQIVAWWLRLSGCDLAGATLPQSVGGGLDLQGCDLAGATLPQSVGGGLDLRGARNVDPAQWWREGGETRRRHCIAVSHYALTETDDGRYIAGCRYFDRAEALAHWGAPDRADKRARLFVAAILASEVGL